MTKYFPALLFVLCVTECKGDTILPGTASATNKYDAGYFDAGYILHITVSGTINIVGSTGYNWITNPDGSLAGPMTFPGAYSYAHANATNYPTVAGGDGINHFPGGGANYDTAFVSEFGHYGFAGAQTTNTADPAAIRFGGVVGAFVGTPARDDWFFIGYGTTVFVPDSGAHLYLAINDGTSVNNTGSYLVSVTAEPAPVPEPSSLVAFASLSLAGVGIVFLRRRRQEKSSVAAAEGSIMERSVLSIVLVVSAIGFGGATRADTILGNPADGTVDVNGLAGDFGLPTLRAGTGGNNVRGHADIFFFAIPDVPSPASITGATLRFTYLDIARFTHTVVPEFNVDLFGIGARATPTIVSSDYHDGDAALSTDTLIAESIITPTTPTGNLENSGTRLLDFVKSLYQPNGDPVAAYAVFRLNPDVELPPFRLPYSGYVVASADNTDNNGAFVPRLTLDVVPEPSSVAAFASLSLTGIGLAAWKRRKRQ